MFQIVHFTIGVKAQQHPNRSFANNWVDIFQCSVILSMILSWLIARDAIASKNSLLNLKYKIVHSDEIKIDNDDN